MGPFVKDNMTLTERSKTVAMRLFRARFQVHPPLFTPIAEAQAMPCRRADPVAVQHAQRDDRDTEITEPFAGFFQHRPH